MKTNETRSHSNQLIEHLNIAVMIISQQDGIFLYANSIVSRDLDIDADKLIGSHYRDIFWPEFLSVYETLCHQCQKGAEETLIYYWDARSTWEQVTAKPFLWENTLPAVMLTITNVTDLAREVYVRENMYYFNEQFALPNGLKLEKDIAELNKLENVVLLYFEVERLNEIGQLYGWNAADYLMISIRNWLKESEYERTQLYYVNNGFASLGQEVTLANAKIRSDHILNRFKTPWTIPFAGTMISIYCTINIGIVNGKYVQHEMRSLLQRTSQSAAKNNTYAVYDDITDKQAREELQLNETLINCVLNNMSGFEVHYQPIVNIRTLQWSGVEALCRWTTPDGQRIPPQHFIHLAEQLGLINQVDTWVRETAMNQCVELGLSTKEFFLDINFSPYENFDDQFITQLLASIRQTHFPLNKLNLEITESNKMIFDQTNLQGMVTLSERGITLSLDDFGTGYSSLENLMKLPASILKTEKLFIDDIEEDHYKQYIFGILADISHHSDMQLIAEGVERTAQLDLLKGYQVDYIQGYLFSRPLSMTQLQDHVDRFLPAS